MFDPVLNSPWLSGRGTQSGALIIHKSSQSRAMSSIQRSGEYSYTSERGK
jgi:hypothetical protein